MSASIDPRETAEPWARPDAESLSLTELVAFIRARCPWAQAHTHTSLGPFAVEELVELLAAEEEAAQAAGPGEESALDGAVSEIGDVLYQALIHAALIDDRRGLAPGTTMESAESALAAKLIRRHPHVFDSAHPVPIDEVQRRYAAVKADEKESGLRAPEPSADAQAEAVRIAAAGLERAAAAAGVRLRVVVDEG